MSRFLCLLLLLLPTVAIAQNQKLSERALFESEPFIAMDPTNSQHLCSAWMSGRLVGGHPVTIVTRSSSDGGTTWSAPQDMPHMADGWQSADVSMAWPSSDTLYLCYIDYLDSTYDSGGVFVFRSSDGGMHWSQPMRAIDAKSNNYASLDRPWIAADHGGNIYIPTKPAPWHPTPNHAFFTYSNDRGEHWTEIQVDSADYSSENIPAPMGSVVAFDNGAVLDAYPFVNFPRGGFALATSRDFGHSFSRSMLMQAVPSEKNPLVKGGFKLLVDPVHKNPFGGGNHLAVVWTDARNGDYDIFCSTTGDTDVGINWGPAIRVNDDPIANGVLQDMVWPTYASDGTLVIVWRDRRNGTGTGYQSASDTYYAFSRDGGNTFSKNYRLSDSTAEYKPILDNPGNDFMSVVATHDSLYGVWADTRTGTVQVYFAKAALGSTSWVGEQSLSSNNVALSCYPNPASNSCKIEYMLDKPSHCALRIISETGKVLRDIVNDEEHSGKHSRELSLAGLASGSYWIELRADSGVTHERLVIK
jgi:hypothetical protein